MKHVILITLCLVTLNGIAQSPNDVDRIKNMEKIRKQMTPKDIAGLRTKKLTLHLDLNETQQQKVYDLVLAETEEQHRIRAQRKAENKDLSKDDFVNMQNKRLDRQIAFKANMKSILSSEQYKKFENMKPKRHSKNRMRKARS